MDPVILLGGVSAFFALYPFLCSQCMVLLEPEQLQEETLYQGSANQASDYHIIKNLHITHVVNATANCPGAFPSMLKLPEAVSERHAQQDLVEALPLASWYINSALMAAPAGLVLLHCSIGRGRSSALTLAYLMEHRHWSLLHAVCWLKERRACSAPNVNL